MNIVDDYLHALFVYCYYIHFFFYEDDIRNLVRSDGLGDVYRCQVLLRGVLWCGVV